MGKRQRRLGKEFEAEAVRLVETSGRTQREIAEAAVQARHRQPAYLSGRPEPPRPGLRRGRPEPEVGR